MTPEQALARRNRRKKITLGVVIAVLVTFTAWMI
jgi:hypothetical protein